MNRWKSKVCHFFQSPDIPRRTNPQTTPSLVSLHCFFPFCAFCVVISPVLLDAIARNLWPKKPLAKKSFLFASPFGAVCHKLYTTMVEGREVSTADPWQTLPKKIASPFFPIYILPVGRVHTHVWGVAIDTFFLNSSLKKSTPLIRAIRAPPSILRR